MESRVSKAIAPIVALVLALVAIDQALLRSGLLRVDPLDLAAWARAWQKPFAAQAEASGEEVAQMILVGSSRAEAILEPYLAAAAKQAGLPHRPFNLGISGGTPSLIWIGLENLSTTTRVWPKGSKIVYLISTFEFGSLQVQKLATMAEGREVLTVALGPDSMAMALEVPVEEIRNSTLRRLYPHSGFARWAVNAPRFAPEWFLWLQQLRYLPAVNYAVDYRRVAVPEADCGTGLSPRPVNIEALERMARHFRSDLIIAFAPYRSDLMACDAQAIAEAEAILDELRQRWGIVVVPAASRPFALPDETWSFDTNHVTTDEGRRIVAQAIMAWLR